MSDGGDDMSGRCRWCRSPRVVREDWNLWRCRDCGGGSTNAEVASISDDMSKAGEDPMMVTAADYETHIASLEAEVEQLRDELDRWRYCRECGSRDPGLTPDYCPACGVTSDITALPPDRAGR